MFLSLSVNRLKKLIQEPIKRSTRTYTYRGNKEKANEYWKIIHDRRENTIVYQIDTDNPKLIEIAKETPKKNILSLKDYLKNLAKNLPINHIHSKVSSDPKSIKQDGVEFEFTEEQLEALNKLWNT